MAIIAEAVRHMLASGMSPEAIVAAVSAMEEASPPFENLSPRQLRNKRYYVKVASEKRLKPSESVLKRLNSDGEDFAHIENAPAPDSLFLPSEVVKKERKKESKVTASRFALDAIPPEWVDYCKLKRPDLDPFETFDAFRDWWIAQPGGKALKSDWFATWRTWVRRQDVQKTGKFNATGHTPTKDERARAAVMRAAIAGGYAPGFT